MGEISRQRKWQLEQEAKGLCPSCSQPKVFGSDRCIRHHFLRMLRKSGLALAETARPHQFQRRDKIFMAIMGRYKAVVAGSDVQDVNELAYELWHDFAFTRHSGGEKKLGRIIIAFDKRAKREAAK